MNTQTNSEPGADQNIKTDLIVLFIASFCVLLNLNNYSYMNSTPKLSSSLSVGENYIGHDSSPYAYAISGTFYAGRFVSAPIACWIIDVNQSTRLNEAITFITLFLLALSNYLTLYSPHNLPAILAAQFMRGVADFSLYLIVWVVSLTRRLDLSKKLRTEFAKDVPYDDPTIQTYFKDTKKKYATSFWKLVFICSNIGSFFGNIAPALFEHYGRVEDVLYLTLSVTVFFFILQVIKILYNKIPDNSEQPKCCSTLINLLSWRFCWTPVNDTDHESNEDRAGQDERTLDDAPKKPVQGTLPETAGEKLEPKSVEEQVQELLLEL